MLLRKLEKHWPEIAKIGVDAEDRGRPLGLLPSWADAPDSAINADRFESARRFREGVQARMEQHRKAK